MVDRIAGAMYKLNFKSINDSIRLQCVWVSGAAAAAAAAAQVKNPERSLWAIAKRQGFVFASVCVCVCWFWLAVPNPFTVCMCNLHISQLVFVYIFNSFFSFFFYFAFLWIAMKTNQKQVVAPPPSVALAAISRESWQNKMCWEKTKYIYMNLFGYMIRHAGVIVSLSRCNKIEKRKIHSISADTPAYLSQQTLVIRRRFNISG